MSVGLLQTLGAFVGLDHFLKSQSCLKFTIDIETRTLFPVYFSAILVHDIVLTLEDTCADFKLHKARLSRQGCCCGGLFSMVFGLCSLVRAGEQGAVRIQIFWNFALRLPAIKKYMPAGSAPSSILCPVFACLTRIPMLL